MSKPRIDVGEEWYFDETTQRWRLRTVIEGPLFKKSQKKIVEGKEK
jgi:hypothetical protein